MKIVRLDAQMSIIVRKKCHGLCMYEHPSNPGCIDGFSHVDGFSHDIPQSVAALIYMTIKITVNACLSVMKIQ